MHLRPIPLELLDDAPTNANRMADAKYAGLVESIKRVGFVVPIVVRPDQDRWTIVDGHHRVRAFKEVRVSTTIPSVVLEAGEDPRLVSLALNRLRGETDLSIASLMVDDMLSGGLSFEDMSISGFTVAELAELVEALNNAEPELGDLADATMPEEVGAPVMKPFLLELTFRTRDELSEARKALRKACGKGGDLSDGLLRLVRG